MDAEIDVVSYLAGKGIQTYKANGPEVTAHCWYCPDGDPRGKGRMYVNTVEGFFDCKRCGQTGGTYLLQKHFGDEPVRMAPGADPNVRRKILDWAADVGSAMLIHNDDMLMYLMHERGLTAETIVERKLGFVGHGWSLTGSLPEEFTRDELMSTALVYRDGPRAGKDFFYNHLLIPYLSRGHCVQVRGKVPKAKYFTGPGDPVRLYSQDDLDGAEDVLITEGEYDCFSGDTQVLTEAGWQRLDAYRSGDRVVQYEEDGTLRLVRPFAFVAKDAARTIELSTSRNGGINLQVTPTHRMVATKSDGSGLLIHKAETPPPHNYHVPRVGVLDGPGIAFSDSEIRLLMAMSADATIDVRKFDGSQYVRFGLKRQYKIDALRKVLADLGIESSDAEIGAGYTSICFRVPAYLVAFKVFPIDWLMQASARQREVLLAELELWDGNIVRNRTQSEFATTLMENAEWAQALAHTAGRVSTIMRRTNVWGKWFKVSILHNKRSTSWQSISTTEAGPQRVYCVQVPSTMLLVRRAEQIAVSGNCMVLKQHLAESPEDRIRKIAVIGLAGANGFTTGMEGFLSEAKRIYIALDPDDTGKREAVKIKDRLGSRARLVELPAQLPKCDWTEFLLPVPDNATVSWHLQHPHAGHGWRDVVALLGHASGKRVYSMQETGFAFRTQVEERVTVRTGYHQLDATIQGMRPGQVMVVLAKTGCIAGDADIAVNRAGKGFTIKLADLVDRWEGKHYAWNHEIPTYVQREVDGQVRLGRLVNAWRSGIKTTYTVTTDAGRTIRATDEHPFLTERGWLRLDGLVVGDQVHVRGQRSGAGRAPKVHYAKRTVRYHPYAARRNVKDGGHSVPLHRLVVEAQMNDLTSVDEYVKLLNDPEFALWMAQTRAQWECLDPAFWAVHHIDHDHTNNDPSNLKVLTKSEHAALHAEEGTTRNVQVNIALERVVGVEVHGQEETYDLEVSDDPHNFLANGFVVHNTGKTIFLCNLAYNMRAHKVLFLSLEMTKEECYERLRRIFLHHHPRASDYELEQAMAGIFICDENRLGDRDLATLVDEFEIESGVRPDVVFVDYLGYYARGQKGNSPYEKTTNAVMQLKAEAKAGRFVCIVPAQVNRGTKEGKPIDLDDARDSGAIEETADFLLSLWRPDDALQAEVINMQQSGKTKMTILKSRHGGKDKTFTLVFDLLTLAMVDDGTPESRVAAQHNYLSWRGDTWEDLRADQTKPIQSEMPYRRDLQ